MHVFVLDTNKQPLMSCHLARARQLLKARKAVFRHAPFTIILHACTDGDTQPTKLKIDPGAKTTGIALIVTTKRVRRMVWAADLHHRGERIKYALAQRCAVRRSRRGRKTRYCQPRFLNRTCKPSWIPPSLESRVATIETWVARLRRACPVTSLALELVRFDTHAMQSPDIYGVKYQQGSLHGYEVRGYLLQKWERRCAYCGAKDVPLQVAHIVPKARGDSDRVSNLTLACNDCNQWKGSQAAAEFGFPTIQGQSKQPLKDAAVVNTTRLRLYERLRTTGLPLACGSGGRTKSNRTQQDYPKAHRIDAACVGTTDDQVRLDSNMSVLVIRAMGHGNQQMCWTNRHGFPIRHRTRVKRFWGFQTGDLVRAVVPTGNHQGMHVRRVTIRQRPSFRENGVDVHPKYVRVLQKRDGYGYELRHGGAGATRAAFAVDGT